MQNSFQFKDPRPKKYGNLPIQQPYPVPLSSLSEIPASVGLWWDYEGYLQDNSVIVEEPTEIEALFYMGFFGKTTLSSQLPEFLKSSSKDNESGASKQRPVLEKRRFIRHKDWQHLANKKENNSEQDCSSIADDDNGDDEEISVISPTEQEVIVIEDSDNETDQQVADITQKWQPTLQNDPFPVSEVLHLTLEESFFLVYGLGCLTVLNQSKEKMDISSLWKYCCTRNSRFPVLYAAYHYFRSKGWVVKNGITFGSEFSLYKEGPPFYHASYLVFVVPIEEETLCPDPVFPSKSLNWADLSGLNRTTEQVAKEVLFCHVIRPSDLTLEDMKSSPICLKKLKIQEMLLRRWIPSQERESDQC